MVNSSLEKGRIYNKRFYENNKFKIFRNDVFKRCLKNNKMPSDKMVEKYNFTEEELNKIRISIINNMKLNVKEGFSYL